MNRNIKLYAWLYEVFGLRDFGTGEYRVNFPSKQAPKILFDLVKIGFLVKVRRGIYRVVEPEQVIKKIVEENSNAENVLKISERKYAYCGSDAVNIWTDGFYWTGFTKAYKPRHIKILKSDRKYWISLFKKNNIDFVFSGKLETRTLFGVIYVLHPVDKLSVVNKDSEPVAPLKETIEFCKENILAYSPALEYLDNKYKLRLGLKREVEYV